MTLNFIYRIGSTYIYIQFNYIIFHEKRLINFIFDFAIRDYLLQKFRPKSGIKKPKSPTAAIKI